MDPEHPTGLEIRFEREMAAAIPGWQSETAQLDPLVEKRPPSGAVAKRNLLRTKPLLNKVAAKFQARRTKAGERNDSGTIDPA